MRNEMTPGKCCEIDDMWHDIRVPGTWFAEHGTAKVKRTATLRARVRKIGIWLGLVEPRWWESAETDSANVIRSRDLLDALNHRGV